MTIWKQGLKVASIILIASCSDKNILEIDSGRSAQFLGDYAEYYIIGVEAAKDASMQNREFLDKHKMKNTQMVIDSMVDKLLKNKTTNAYANVFEKKTGGYQCIIVHQMGVSQSVLDHERGHCFKRLFLQVLKTLDPELRKNYLGRDEYSKYIGESFAEVVAATRAYHIDSDFSYLVTRLAEIQDKASFLNAYKASIPLLLQLKHYLSETAKLPQKPEEQIEHIIESFFVNKVLSRDDFEQRQWWRWIQ